MYQLEIAPLYNGKIDIFNQLILNPNKNYTVASIDGLAPPPANVTGMPLMSTDGQIINVHRIDVRDIVITVYINNPVRENRIALYNVLHTKQNVRLRFSNVNYNFGNMSGNAVQEEKLNRGIRDVYIDGYVENFECDLFSMRQVAQITIKCLDPYFRDTVNRQTILSITNKKFEFSFKIADPPGRYVSERTELSDTQFKYLGDAPTGVEIEMDLKNSFTGAIKITDTVRNKSLSINHTWEFHDTLKINTNPGYRNITLVRKGKSQNLINALVDGSTWISIEPGTNSIAVTTPGNKGQVKTIDAYMSIRNKYLGV